MSFEEFKKKQYPSKSLKSLQGDGCGIQHNFSRGIYGKKEVILFLES